MDTANAPTTWPEFIRHRRHALGLTQTDVADRAGVRQTDISRWENGKYDPPTKALGGLAVALEITGDELLALARQAVA